MWTFQTLSKVTSTRQAFYRIAGEKEIRKHVGTSTSAVCTLALRIAASLSRSLMYQIHLSDPDIHYSALDMRPAAGVTLQTFSEIKPSRLVRKMVSWLQTRSRAEREA